MALLTIELPDKLMVTLTATAQAKGLSAEQYARQILDRDLAPAWLRKSWIASKEAGLDQLSAEEIDAEIAAARKVRNESGSPGDHISGRS